MDAIFAEVHPDPDHAFSDGPNQIHLSNIRKILEEAVAIDDLIKGNQKTGRQGNEEAKRQVDSELKTQNSELKTQNLLLPQGGRGASFWACPSEYSGRAFGTASTKPPPASADLQSVLR